MGHPPDAVWSYTPRQITGFLKYAARRRKQDMPHQLWLGAMASRGDPKEITKLVKEAAREN